MLVGDSGMGAGRREKRGVVDERDGEEEIGEGGREWRKDEGEKGGERGRENE